MLINELSPQELAVEQSKDPRLQELLAFLADGTLPKRKPPLPLSEFEERD